MRRLILLRHAKSDWTHHLEDVERPLAPRGLADAPRVGAYLVDGGLVPERVLVSPARRTVQTWDLAAAAIADAPRRVLDEDLYAASARRLLQVVRERGGNVASLLLVGHNPGVHDLVATLAAPDQRGRVPLDFPTATLAVIDLPIDDWADAAAGTGVVERVVVKPGPP